MAKAFVALITSALCLLALLASPIARKMNSSSKAMSTVTLAASCSRPESVTKFLVHAEVELNCRGQDNHTVTYTVSGKADKEGKYSLKVTGDHQDEICDVTAVNSPDTDCDESVSDINKARISLTGNSGMESTKRFANPIGFRKKELSCRLQEGARRTRFRPTPKLKTSL
ncbi:hypothetical protein HYC85_011822 [Camellia sinensis]|uniref:Uncharacterized protein n=1 Tax=Camellia sinensis TaxID=4442 RepID=A0A7J7HAQ3_CAMSI|nr:hypothetical protein HYC85_011822 [Camellia sinensis]